MNKLEFMFYSFLKAYFSFVVVLLLHDFQDSVQQFDPQTFHHICPQVFYGSLYLGWSRRGAFQKEQTG